MADFISALYGADESQSEELHQAMQVRFFSRTHVSVEGSVGRLAEKTYFSQSLNMTATDVRDLATIAAAMTGCRYDVVTVCGDIAHSLYPGPLKAVRR